MNANAKHSGLFCGLILSTVANCMAAITPMPCRIVSWGADDLTNCPTDKAYVAVSAGAGHSVALRKDGSLVAWGWNDFGQTNCPAGTNFIGVAAGWYHNVAVRDDGTLVAWGANWSGETNCPAGTNYVAVAAGLGHSAALRADGTLTAWGANWAGQCNCPTDTTFAAVVAGGYRGIALGTDNGVREWGGVPNVTQTFMGYARTVAASRSHALAVVLTDIVGLTVISNGGVAAWGASTNRPAGTNYLAVASGGGFSYSNCFGLALRTDGTITCWGSNDFDQTNCPAGKDYKAVAAGEAHALALLACGPALVFTSPPTNIWVSYDTSSFLVLATNDGVAGDIGVTVNGGATNGFQADNPLSTNIDLSVGINTVTLTATNVYGISASASISITRGDIGTGSPFVDITNTDQTVSYDISSTDIGGTNNAHVVGDMWWTNSLTGDGGSFATCGLQFTISGIALAVGNNIITVVGTNVLGVQASDTVSIVRQPEPPVVSFNDTDGTVAFSVAWRDFHGTAARVAGQLWWSNDVTGAHGQFGAVSPWVLSHVPLDVGVNTLTICGTNAAGVLATDLVVFERLPAGACFVDITDSASITVPEGTTTWTINGTNMGIVGGMWWHNSLSGSGGTFAAVSPWSALVDGLEIGYNAVTVYGSNDVGVVASDSISILRPEHPATHVVKVASPAPGSDASVATYITVVSECDTNCAAQIGWGQTTNGSGWVWTSNLTTVCIGQDAYTTAFSITPPIGTNYIAARWIHGYLTNYGWQFWGNSNAFSLESTLMLCVTASPPQIIAHPWDFSAATLDGVSLGTGLTVASVGDDLLVVDGISHSAVRDDQRAIGFTLSTMGKIGVTFHVKVRRDGMGPRLVELDYHDGAQWRTYPMLYPLDETGVWYALGGRIPGDGADNRASAQFRIVAYNATASSLDLQSPVITTPVPEPAAMLLVLAIGAFRRRRFAIPPRRDRSH